MIVSETVSIEQIVLNNMETCICKGLADFTGLLTQRTLFHATKVSKGFLSQGVFIKMSSQ